MSEGNSRSHSPRHRWGPVSTALTAAFLLAALFVRSQQETVAFDPAYPFVRMVGQSMFWGVMAYLAWRVWDRKYPISIFFAIAAAAVFGNSLREVYIGR